MIAPSGMIDGCVQALRSGLDKNKFSDVAIMGYSAKFASAFYGPFRDAVNSAPQFGDRHTYQMNPANGNEALREVQLDIEEGADIVMVKPALAYLDIIRAVKQKYHMPTAAYNASPAISTTWPMCAKTWPRHSNLAEVERSMTPSRRSVLAVGASVMAAPACLRVSPLSLP